MAKSKATYILISDGLLIKKDIDGLLKKKVAEEVKHVIKRECLIEDVPYLVNEEKPSKQKVFLISAGSLNATAKGCGWDHSIIKNKSNLVEDAFMEFKKCLLELDNIRRKKRCIIRMVGLLPLPKEQDIDDAPEEEKELSEMLSRLFVHINNEIKRFNGGGGTVTLEKFVSLSGQKQFKTGQKKMKFRAYKEGNPTEETKDNLSRRIIKYLESM